MMETGEMVEVTSSSESEVRPAAAKETVVATVVEGCRRRLVAEEPGVYTVMLTEQPVVYTAVEGDSEMMRRYLQDTVTYQVERDEPETGAEVYEHFLFGGGGGGTSDPECGETQSTSSERVYLENYVGHKVGVTRDLTKGLAEDDLADFNSSDSFASTESIIPKNIQCPKCPKRFMFKADLTRHDRYKHMRIIESYFCRVCKKAFDTKDMLKLHEPVHTRRSRKVAQYKCHLCGKTYKTAGSYSSHLKKCCDTSVNK